MKSRWLPPGLFALVTLFLFRDFVFSNAMLFGQDTEGLGYAARAFFAEALRNGNFPGWNPYILGGTPFLASLAGGDSLYPLSAPLLLVMETYRALGWKLVLHVFLAGVGMYAFTRALGVGRWAATIAGLGYLVAPYFVTLVYPAHDGKIFVTALTPFLFLAVHLWVRDRRAAAWTGIGVVVALATLTTHFQMAYFLFLAAGAWGLFLAIGEAKAGKGRRRAATGFGLFVAASLLGVGAAGVQFLPALDYIMSDSRRTATTTGADAEANKAYASSWSLHPEEGLSLVLPEFVGNNAGTSEWTTGTYWGRNPFKLNHEYLGSVLLLLAAVGFVAPAARRLRWYFLGMGGLALLHALGAHTPVWHLAYALLPGVSLFRAASMAIFLTGFAVTVLAAFGADRLIAHAEGATDAGEQRIDLRILFGGAGIAGVLFFLAASGGLASIWTSTLYTSITPEKRAALLSATEFITRGALVLALLALATTALGWYATQRKLPSALVFAGLALLVTFDGARVDASFIRTKPFEAFGAPEPMEAYIAEKVGKESPFRLFDMRAGDGSVRGATFGIELTWGHHPNDLARYRTFIGSDRGGLPQNLLLSENLLRLTNTRYVLWPSAQYGDPVEQGVAALADATAETASQLPDGRTYETLYRVDDLPRARLVGEVRVAPDAEVVGALMQPDFPVDRVVIVPEDLGVEVAGGDPIGEVEWLERDVDASRLRVSTDRAALLVLAENWYDGWQASVDGERAEVHRVNLTQQAVAIPAGTHEVEMVHHDPRVRAGFAISVVSSLLLFGVAGIGALRRRRLPTHSSGAPEAARDDVSEA
ncbi:MAG: hypothetical protein RQ745_11785 [Longimicrobiales bacterium]|nr:hypothetical protein [Longimicrobiales bacterium]